MRMTQLVGLSDLLLSRKGEATPKALRRSFGVMVNDLCDLAEIERNREAFAEQGKIAVSSPVTKSVRDAKPSKSSKRLATHGTA